MRTAAMKAYELYVAVAFVLSWWAIHNTANDYAEAAAGAGIALSVVGINEAIARRFRRPDPLRCAPPECYCGTCEECQRILRLESVINRTDRIDSYWPPQ